MLKKPFVAIVGPTGSGKTTLLKGLQGRLPRELFLSDSGSQRTNPGCTEFDDYFRRLIEAMDEIVRPTARLTAFWTRLSTIIDLEIKPSLDSKTIIIDGFGGTVFAEAWARAHSQVERESILSLHKACINAFVVGNRVPPPLYLWLEAPETVIYDRLEAAGRLPRGSNPREYIRRVNEALEFYGTLQGQRVVSIDATQPPEVVLEQAWRLIGNEHSAAA